MPRRGRVEHCGICNSPESKYSCPHCFIPYCSAKCYKEHKGPLCPTPKRLFEASVYGTAGTCVEPITTRTHPVFDENLPRDPEAQLRRPEEDENIPDAPILKSLTSLKWPCIPEVPSYTDPLERNRPKPLQLRHYQPIAISPAIRAAISSGPRLPSLLRKLDKLRGSEREEALERLLGVSTGHGETHGKLATSHALDSEDVKAMKRLAEAVEKAVRGDQTEALGLDWEERLL